MENAGKAKTCDRKLKPNHEHPNMKFSANELKTSEIVSAIPIVVETSGQPIQKLFLAHELSNSLK
jgi:hypothetical protein